MPRQLLTTLALVVSCSNAAADIAYRGPSQEGKSFTPPTVVVSGTIRAGDLTMFKQALAQAEQDGNGGRYFTVSRKPFIQFELNTGGGHLLTALKMGEAIRASEGMSFVPMNGLCASSCVFLLAGGVIRVVGGKVGIHRPYDPQDETTNPAVQKAHYAEIEKSTKAYLDSVNIPVVLYDRMFRISSERVKWLSENELSEYGLNQNDPYYEEANKTKMAKQMGLTKEELVQMYAALNQTCEAATNYSKCFSKFFQTYSPRLSR